MSYVIGSLVVLCLALQFYSARFLHSDPLKATRIWLWSVRVMFVIFFTSVLYLLPTVFGWR